MATAAKEFSQQITTGMRILAIGPKLRPIETMSIPSLQLYRTILYGRSLLTLGIGVGLSFAAIANLGLLSGELFGHKDYLIGQTLLEGGLILGAVRSFVGAGMDKAHASQVQKKLNPFGV